jgi:hypothetical protein
MRWVTAFGRQALAWMVASVSVWFAWRYGMALGGPEGALAFAVLDVYKCKMPRYAIGAVSRGEPMLGIAGVVGFVLLCLLNIWGTMSVEVLERAALAAKHTTAAQQLADLESQRGRVENRLRDIGKTMTVGTVEADMAAKQYDRRWTASNGCTAVTSDSRAYCGAYQKLFGHLAAAQDAENQRARLEELQAQISQLRGAQTPNATELQLVARLTGIDAETAGLIRALVFAAVVEIVCSLAPTLVWINRPGSRARRRRRGRRRSWLAWCKERILRGLTRRWLRFAPPPATQRLDYGGEGEVSPPPATPATGSASETAKSTTIAPTNDGTPRREEAAVPSGNAVRVSPVTPSESLKVVSSPTLGSGPGGGALVEGGAAVPSKIAAETHTRRAPAGLHAVIARRAPAAPSRDRPGEIPRARSRACATSLFEGGRREDGCAAHRKSPLPVITARCVCASHIADFVRECLEMAEGASISFAELRATYHSWCAATRRDAVSDHRLGAALRDLGLEKWKSGRIRYRDLRLRA